MKTAAAMCLGLVVLGVSSVLSPTTSAGEHAITLPPETAILKPSDLPGYQVAQQKCGICHSADYVNLQPPDLPLAKWSAEVTKMQQAYGAPLNTEEIQQLAIYLTTIYGDAGSVSSSH